MTDKPCCNTRYQLSRYYSYIIAILLTARRKAGSIEARTSSHFNADSGRHFAAVWPVSSISIPWPALAWDAL